MGVEAGQFELNVMEPIFVFNVIQSLTIMANGFRVFTKYLLKDLTANPERMKAYVENSVGIVMKKKKEIEKKTKIKRKKIKKKKTKKDMT